MSASPLTPPARSVRAALAACCAVLLTLSGCGSAAPANPLAAARNANQSRHVAERFETHPVVVDDPLGLETSHMLFDASETLVVTDTAPESQLRGASIAVVAHAPMLVYDPSRRDEIVSELQRLKTLTVLTVGDVTLAPRSGTVKLFRDPGGYDALGVMTTLRFAESDVADPSGSARAVAGLDPKAPTWLKATWGEPKVMAGAEARPFPVHSRRDADMAPAVVATPASPVAAVANLRSFGAAVTVVDNPDPRESEETLMAMAGLAELPLIALGPQFGRTGDLGREIMRAEENY